MEVQVAASKLFYKKIKELIFFIRRSQKDKVATILSLPLFYLGLWLYGNDNVIELPLLLKKYQDIFNLYKPFAGILLIIVAIALIVWVIYRLCKIALPPIIPEYKLSHAIKGLMSFNIEDGDLFCKLERNRELTEISQYINNPQEQIIVLMGGSGAGKTSLLRAGLANILKPEQSIYIYWEAFPDNAETSLLKTINSRLDTGYQRLDEVLNHETEAVIVLDQFEQLSVEKHPNIFAMLASVIKQSPPHKLTWIIAFRREYDPEWRDFELSLGDDRHPPMLSLRLFSQAQAQNVFTILANEAGLILDQALVDSFISSMQCEGQISPVDISIGLLMLSELASRKQKKHLNLEDYQFAGESEGLFVGFISAKLTRFSKMEQQELLKVLLELIDSDGYKRKAEGEDLQKLLTVAELPESQLTRALNYFSSNYVRLLEKLPNGFYRLPHETIIPGLRRLTGLVLAEAEQAKFKLKTAYEAWQKSGEKNNAYLLKGKDLKKVLKYLPQIDWQAQNKEIFIHKSIKRRRRRYELSAGIVLLLLLSGGYGWQVYNANIYRDALLNWGLPADLYDYQTQFEKLKIHDEDVRHIFWLKQLPNLKELSLNSRQINNFNEAVEKLPALTSLNLSGTNLSSLQGLEKLPALTSLDLSDTNLSSLQRLEKLTELTSLNVSYTNLSSLQGLEKLTALTSLNLSNTNLSSLQGLEQLTALTSLNISGPTLSSLQSLEKLPALTSLDLSNTNLNSLQGLEKLPALTSLSLRDGYLNSFKGLEKLTMLTSLDLSGTKLSSLQGLEKLTALTSLDLSSTNLVSSHRMGKLTALTSLNLSDTKLSSLHDLEKLPALTSLDLSNTNLNSLQGLEQLTALTSLNISGTTLSSLQSLEKLTVLTSLDLSNTNLSSLQRLEKLTALTSLNISSTTLSNLQGLEKLTALTSLNLSDTKLSSLQRLEKLPALTSLSIGYSYLGSLQGLEKLPALTSLDLSNTNLSSLRGLPFSVTELTLGD